MNNLYENFIFLTDFLLLFFDMFFSGIDNLKQKEMYMYLVIMHGFY